jgi:hypothetical protein
MGPSYAATRPDGAHHCCYYRILTGQGKNAKGGAPTTTSTRCA